MSATLIESLASWAISLRAEDVPTRIFEAARIQIRSVLAATFAGAQSTTGKQCKFAALELKTTGQATIFPSGESVAPYAAVLANAASAMVHDFDDYLFLGHTGHSAVLASLAVGEEVDASLDEMILAQIAANEVAGRLGAYVAIGPQNGQLWAHIHLAAAVLAGARLYKMSADQAADALAIAFHQPPFTLFYGFMASEAKALTAAQPTATGLYALSLAKAGMRGGRQILEHSRGFATQFAFIPIEETLRGLGKAWVLDSLSCKIYPGCAYIDGPVDAALNATSGQPYSPSDIKRIDIKATALTAGMEAIAEDSAPPDSLNPIVVNFSARRSVAIAVLTGELTPRHTEEKWLSDNADDVRDIADKVRIRVSAEQTAEMLQGIGLALPLWGLARKIGMGRFWRARHRLRAAYFDAAKRGGGQKEQNESRSSAFGLLGRVVRSTSTFGNVFRMESVDFSELQFRFSAEVCIHLHDGRRLQGSQKIPQGAAGGGQENMRELMVAKLVQESSAANLPKAAAHVESLLSSDGKDSVRSLCRGLVT